MSAVLLIIHIMAAIAVVVLVLLQQGKGADIGAAFGGGGGGSQSIFGSRGSANFLSHITAVLVAVFLFTSLSLAFIHQKSGEFESVTERVPEVSEPPAPSESTQTSADEVGSSSAGVTEIPEVPNASDSVGEGANPAALPGADDEDTAPKIPE